MYIVIFAVKKYLPAPHTPTELCSGSVPEYNLY